MSGSKLAFVAAPEGRTSFSPREVVLPMGRRDPESPALRSVPRASLRAVDLDESIDLGPDALAGTIGVVEAVASPEQIANLTPAARYMPMGPIGRGGMGRVDMAFDRALGRPVAKKTVLRRSNAALLLTEAQVGAQLEHPSIVPVYDVEVDEDGRPHYTMRVVRGRTLRDAIETRAAGEKGAMTLAQGLGVLRQVCLAAHYAHSRGVVHRDLKPENVIVGEYGEVYVLDWGVAHIMPSSDLHQPNRPTSLQIAGTPGYMPPEQMAPGPLDARADVFALGVMLHEILTGERPSADSIETQPYAAPMLGSPPPRLSISSVPAPFDVLVAACLSPCPDARPATARLLADAIDEYLDGERARAERRAEADAHSAEGERARDAFDTLDREAKRLDTEAQRLIAEVRPWDPAEAKQPAWELAEQAERLRAEASRALARGEAAFTRALGRVPDHAGARRGLAALYFRQFQSAETNGDRRKMAQYLDLARAYDDGPLALQLCDEGTLEVRTSLAAEVTVARYEQRGLLLVPDSPCALPPSSIEGAREGGRRLASGSYLITARLGDVEVRYPLVIRRAHSHVLTLRFDNAARLPSDMVFIPGGPFVALPPRETRMIDAWLGDFAIGRFPVTFAEYVRMLDEIEDPAERRRWTPEHQGRPLVERSPSGAWQLAPHAVEGEGRKRIADGQELSVPVFSITWFQAAAYVRWLSRKTGRPYRLPTDLEWEKAARGADGRAYPMGHRIDPSFAKLRESRPEAPQPEPVGAFIRDESPYGVRDLAGGVGDWTSTAADGTSLSEADIDEAEADERVAFHRGGSWGTSILTHMRYPTALRSRPSGTGFRLALDLDPACNSDLHVTALELDAAPEQSIRLFAPRP